MLGLKRVKGADPLLLAVPPAFRCITMILYEHIIHIITPHFENLPQALVNEHVLAPLTGPTAFLCEMAYALFCTSIPGLNRIA